MLRCLPFQQRKREVDALGPVELQRQPERARQTSADQLNFIESAGTWPAAVSAALGAAIPKGARGHRAPGLAPMTPKVWSNMRAKASSQ